MEDEEPSAEDKEEIEPEVKKQMKLDENNNMNDLD